ncbi:MAG: NAD(P)H-dependent oxidoreductase [Alphaproteobacteria bacterium]|nr:NAD(P)H-dependent oxidoreductase [Alphaproteobacteria bacterium]
MSAPKILIIPGSARKDSLNKKLAAVAAERARDAGAEVTLIDLNDYPAPIYHGDDEAETGMPDTMRQLKAQIRAHDALMIATPEYNGHVPPLLVNAFDWVSRADGDDKSNAFAGKLGAILSASPGRLGGARVIPRMRAFLADLGVMSVPGFASLPGAMQAFDENGALTSEHTIGQIDKLVAHLMSWFSQR